MSGRNLTIGYSITLLASVLLLFMSGITKDSILYPISHIGELYGGGLSFDPIVLLISAFMFSLSLSFLIRHSMISGRDMATIAGTLPSVIVILLASSSSMIAILGSLGMVLSASYISYSARKKKEEMRKVSISRISSELSSSSMSIINIFLAISVLLVLMGSQAQTGEVMSDISSDMLGMDITGINDTGSMVEDQQKRMAYEQLEMMEQSVLYGIYSSAGNDLAPAERQRCFQAVNSSMEQIDKQAKASIDLQLATQQDKSAGQMRSLDTVIKMFDMLIIYYPFIAALSLLILLEFIKQLLKPVVVLSSLLLETFGRQKAGKHERKEDDAVSRDDDKNVGQSAVEDMPADEGYGKGQGQDGQSFF